MSWTGFGRSRSQPSELQGGRIQDNNGRGTSAASNLSGSYPHRIYEIVYDRSQYPPKNPIEKLGNPDELLNQIPPMDSAVTAFNSVTPKRDRPPYRDQPSKLISTLLLPDLDKPEPNWALWLQFFNSRDAKEPLGNLQDLYIFLTRVALPNAVIDNRRLIMPFYLQNRGAASNFPLRYDMAPIMAYYTPKQERQASQLAVGPRPIFESRPTPDGNRFLKWLNMPITTPPPDYPPQPHQVTHRQSLLDCYLTEDEMALRLIHFRDLFGRTVRVLRVWWWLMQANHQMNRHETGNWKALNSEMKRNIPRKND